MKPQTLTGLQCDDLGSLAPLLLIFLGYGDDGLEFLRYCFIVVLVLHYILTRGSVLSSHIAVGRRR